MNHSILMDSTSIPTSPTLPYVQDSIMTCQLWHRRYYCLSDINVGFNQQWILFQSNSEGYKKVRLTRCSSFLRLTGGCSCNTESASTFKVTSKICSTSDVEDVSPSPRCSIVCSDLSMLSDQLHVTQRNAKLQSQIFQVQVIKLFSFSTLWHCRLDDNFVCYQPPKNPFTPHTTKNKRSVVIKLLLTKNSKFFLYLHSILLCFRYLAGNFKGPAEDR